MESYQVLYSDEALDDLREIYSYIAFVLKEPLVATRLIQRIRKEIQTLGLFPDKYHVVTIETMRLLGMRQKTVGNFVIFYLTDYNNRAVNIVRVLYGRRNLNEIIK
ncbi:MAG: type II toxin-antitoxin system RelE/ParE family toxin [Clostridia bacterium]|nr:type II toxin-antitoxin system RelE/ParE family toxin [Clostridia bacterium]